MPEGERTIAAISTGAAPGGIGIVRVSGPEARAVADRVFRGRNGRQDRPDAGLYRRPGRGVHRRRGEAGRRGGPGIRRPQKLHRGGRGGALLPRGAVPHPASAPGGAGRRGLPRPAGGVHPPGLPQREDGPDPGRGGDGAHRRGGRAGRPGGPGPAAAGPCPSGWGPSGRSSPAWERTWPPGRIFPRRTCPLWKTRPCPGAWSTPPRSFPGCWRASTWGRCTGRGCAP